MTKRKAIRKIGIFGYFGAWNLGDEAVVGVLIENIRKRLPQADISAICLVPENVELQHHIPAFPLRRLSYGQTESDSRRPATIRNSHRFSWSALMKKIVRRLSYIAPKELVFLMQGYMRLKDYDMIVVGGSGQLVDNEGGAWNHPYNHFKWSVLAKLVGARFVFLSVGVGPLNSWLGKWFIKKSLSLASYRSCRDHYSKDLAMRIGVKGEIYVLPDQAFSIQTPEIIPQVRTHREKLVVGIAPIAFCDPRHWSESRVVAYQTYLSKITSFVHWLVNEGYEVVFFHTQVDGDDRVIDEILAKLDNTFIEKRENGLSVHEVRWYSDALAAIAKTDLVIASRFHAVIFSYVMNRPVVAVSYDPKINNVMVSVGQDHFAIDIEKFEVEDLRRKFEQLRIQIPENKARIAEKTQEFQKLIQHQYDQIFGQEGS